MSQETQVEIQDNGSLHRYRTEIPNIVYDLGLSSDLTGFYGYLKRITGDKGSCWKSVPLMAKECGCSTNKIRDMKKALQKPQPGLDNLSLIKIQAGRKKADGSQLSDLITITDIWPVNFRSLSTHSKSVPPPLQNLKGPPSESEPKEERYKKISLKNDNVSQSPKGNTLPSPKPPSPDRDRSSFSNENIIVPFNPETYRLPNGNRLSERCIRAFKKYKGADYAKLLANIEYFEQRAKKGDIEEQEKYLQNCINENYAHKLCLSYQNKLWLEFLVIEHNLQNVKLFKTVAKIKSDREGEVSVKYDLPEQTFTAIVEKLIK